MILTDLKFGEWADRLVNQQKIRKKEMLNACVKNPFIWGHIILTVFLVTLVPGWDNDAHLSNNIARYAVFLFAFIANQIGIYNQTRQIWVKLILKKLRKAIQEMQ